MGGVFKNFLHLDFSKSHVKTLAHIKLSSNTIKSLQLEVKEFYTVYLKLSTSLAFNVLHIQLSSPMSTNARIIKKTFK